MAGSLRDSISRGRGRTRGHIAKEPTTQDAWPAERLLLRLAFVNPVPAGLAGDPSVQLLAWLAIACGVKVRPQKRHFSRTSRSHRSAISWPGQLARPGEVAESFPASLKQAFSSHSSVAQAARTGPHPSRTPRNPAVLLAQGY